MSALVRDLLTLPAHVSRGDFVQSLAESLRDPEGTVRTYAVTPELAQNFRETLRIIGSALSNGRSQPVFLHGSFGSGKSHFMAVLHLMLAGRPEPWRKPELHAVHADYDGVQGKKLLQLNFHMLGAKSFESEVFGRYVDHVRDHHPDADLPGLFRDAEVFDNAAALRSTMGDADFFAALNKGKQAVAGFGALGEASAWTADRFDAALQSTQAKERRALLSDLARTLLPIAAKQTDRFVDTDEGLGEMSRHAASLGYDGIVLYLDELILWLASQSADLAFVQREITKLVKLKEAQDEARDIPIVAFIARQRDLSELVGDGATGAERATIEGTLGHHRSRFHTVDLSDSNLRAIIPHRVVVAKSDDDRERIHDGFAAMWTDARKALGTLQAGTADRDDFQQVYPFSPALVDVLIALSDRLQRDRTAIRILVEMLVEHLPDLKLGEVVPVGDVFDLVASADDAVDGPSRVAFQRARDLYQHELLPLIQKDRNATDAATCQRLRPEHPVRIGCSGCPVAKCRNDNRLVKTLLLAALVPKARPFRNLTVKRLLHLNHGAVRAPVEPMAVNLAATRLRAIQRDVNPIRVGDESDPTVSISLQSVDLKPILHQVESQDSPSRRRYVLRELFWEALGIDSPGNDATLKIEFHHTHRVGRVKFGNVRQLRADDLVCPPSAEFQIVVDYPFDERGYTPEDDERKLEEIRSQLARPTSTLVWLPTFFSARLEQDLGDLAKLDFLMQPKELAKALAYLQPDDQPRARVDLETLQGRKKADVLEGLRKALGMGGRVQDGDVHLDLDRDVSQHVHSLDPNVDARTPRGANLMEGAEDLAEQLLVARYPRHPHFHAPPSAGRLDRVRVFLEALLEEPTGMLPADKQEREELRRVAEPLKLCRVFEAQVEGLTTIYDTIESGRERDGVDEPTVLQVRVWLDPEGRMGLGAQPANLVAWLWAVKQRRVAMDGRSTLDWPKNARLPDHVVFVKPDLPDEATFSAALDRAAWLGITQPGKALNARNVAKLASALRARATGPEARAAAEVPGLLDGRLAEFGPGSPSPRLRTAAAVVGLLAALQEVSDRALLVAFVAVDLTGTSASAVGRGFSTAPGCARVLGGPSWTVLQLVRGLLGDDRYAARAQSILDRLAALLSDDELTAPLEAGIKALVAEAQALLKPEPPRGWRTVWNEQRSDVDRADALRALDELRDELARRLDENVGDLRLQVSVRLEARDEER